MSVGRELGRVLARPGVAAPAGTVVELLDASNPATPVVLASATTDVHGAFDLAAAAAPPALPARARWLRAHLPAGDILRSFATGWAEVSPASEAMLGEAFRLRQAAAWGTREPSRTELAAAQDTLSLIWRARFAALEPQAASTALIAHLRTRTAWNRVIRSWGSAASAELGDLAGLAALNPIALPSDITESGAPSRISVLTAQCNTPLSTTENSCSTNAINELTLDEQRTVTASGTTITPGSPDATLARVVADVGRLPLVEFPAQLGTRVLFDNPRYDVRLASNLRAAVRVVRRTYEPEPVAALGTTVQALPVVLDYEVAVLNTTTRAQTDYLLRQQRWLVPDVGRVRIDVTLLVRTGEQVVRSTTSAVARSADGAIDNYGDVPADGAADVVARALRHLHAVHSQATGKVYAAVGEGGGRVLELDAATLGTLRTLDTGAVPRRVAVSADGSRLYAGLDGGTIKAYSLSDFSPLSTATVPASPYGVAYDRVWDLRVDPFDATRVLALVGSSQRFGASGAVLVFKDGVLQVRDAPRYYADDYGWGYYSPNVVAWSPGTADEFLVRNFNSPSSLYRVGIRGGAAVDISLLEREDDVGSTEWLGEIVTSTGRVLDATTFALRRTLSYDLFRLRSCQRLEPGSVLCEAQQDAGTNLPALFHLDAATGAFKGVYRPRITSVTNGCANASVDVNSLGLDYRQLTPLGDGRVLVSALATSEGDLCNLQLWTLHGAYP